MKRIKKFGVYQTAKVAAVVYFLISAVVIVPIALLLSLAGASESLGFAFLGGLGAVLLPFLYAALGFIFTAIGCFVYNLVSGWTGGVEVEFEESEGASSHLIEG